jgi:hypothetical protein
MTAIETTRRRKGLGFLVLFALTIPAANWLIGHAGTVCLRDGPCLIPVAFVAWLRRREQRLGIVPV